jgi:hypothetical protein
MPGLSHPNHGGSAVESNLFERRSELRYEDQTIGSVEKSVPHVVLDTNAVGIYAPMRGNPQRLLLAAAGKGQLTLVVPELVVREVVNKWREKVFESIEKMGKHPRELGRYGIDLSIPSPEAVAQRAAGIERGLRKQLEARGVLVAGFPAVDHADVVQRALDRRQPFDPRGKDGYRDTVLWETVLELGVQGEEVILVSSDGRAFATGSESETLAGHLNQEFNERSSAGASIEYLREPDALVERLQADDEKTLNEMRRLAKLRSFRIVFDEALDDAIELFGLDTDEVARLRFPVPPLEAWVREYEAVGEIRPVRAYHLPTGEALAEFEVGLGANIAFHVRGADALLFSNRKDVWLDFDREWHDISSRDEWVSLTTARIIRVRVDAEVELPAGRVRELVVTHVHVEDEDILLPAAEVIDDEVVTKAEELGGTA